MQSVENQIKTKQVEATHDDSYQGETHTPCVSRAPRG